jgi:glutaminyl-peptide cyclotransferase
LPSTEGERADAGRGERLLELVRWQVSLGPRCPGSQGHQLLEREILARLERHADAVLRQPFELPLPSGPARFCNLVGVFRAQHGRQPGGRGYGGAQQCGPQGALLVGTHYDTRLRADRESDPDRVEEPIPGANDGGSGTAILLDLLPLLQASPRDRDLQVAFFDAEDVGQIGGLPFSCGARHFVRQPPVALPSEVLVLDMVGGKGLQLDLEAYCLSHGPSRRLTQRLFQIGRDLGFPPFATLFDDKLHRKKLRAIICDHLPFLQHGIACCLLIDLDYPPWHTQADLPAAMAAGSLAMCSEVVERYLSGSRS